MNSITIVSTRTRRMPAPEPLPEVVETPRQAFLAGWWGGICIGMLIGGSLVFIALHAAGWAK